MANEIKTVVNKSSEEITVLFDGMQHVFESGQERDYTTDVAEHIANESDGLEVVGDEPVVEKVTEEVAEEPEVVEEEPKKAKKAKK